jgi:hypothetical protein
LSFVIEDNVDRPQWKQLAEERTLDAQVLLGLQRWSAAYHLGGYAIECGLKACILARVETDSGVIYRAKDFLNNCWTHDLERLVENAGLKAEREGLNQSDHIFRKHWAAVKDWSEKSRYKSKDQQQASDLLTAITDPNGVMAWIRKHW